MKHLHTWFAVGASLWLGCGGSSDGGSSDGGADGSTDGSDFPTAEATSQTRLTEGEWDSAVNGDADVASVTEAVRADGFTTLEGAGRLETTDGHTLVWAAYAASSGATATVLRDCVESKCTALRGEVVSGAAKFTTAKGEAAAAPLRVQPVMAKDLDGVDHDGKTEIAGPLTVEGDPGIDLSVRELVIASAYGDVHGVSLAAMSAAAKDSGGFTRVRAIPYATAADIDQVLQHGSPADALIWVGASVRQPMGSARKTVGMTVNRGIYGDVTYTADTVKAHLAKHPYGGPGLVVLLGADSRGDGSGQDDEKLSLFSELSDTTGHRSVVAIRGAAGGDAVLKAGAAFSAAFFGGESMAAALTAGNAALQGTDAELVSDRLAKPESIFFAAPLSGALGEKGGTEGTSTHVLSVNATCVGKDGKGYSESNVVNVFANVTIDGAFFSGGRDFEVDGQQLHVDVSGVILGTAEGADVFVKFGGDLQPGIKGLTAYGLGAVTSRQEATKPKRVYYDGTASATSYTNAAGDTCLLKSPELKGKTNEQVSWLEAK